jgi:hypothetical protein
MDAAREEHVRKLGIFSTNLIQKIAMVNKIGDIIYVLV